jgi:hypothetical protein
VCTSAGSAVTAKSAITAESTSTSKSASAAIPAWLSRRLFVCLHAFLPF